MFRINRLVITKFNFTEKEIGKMINNIFFSLGENSIEHYEFMGRYRKMLGHFDFIDDDTTVEDELSNSAYIATHTRITLKLKLLDELSFGTLRSMSSLQSFVDKMLSNSGIIITYVIN